jgi:hypothetical protein
MNKHENASIRHVGNRLFVWQGIIAKGNIFISQKFVLGFPRFSTIFALMK